MGGVETIGARLRGVAQRLPDRVAVVAGDERITYRQLDADATAIARHVAVAAARRSGVVALLFDGKPAAIRALLGVARSGLAYVPLDAGDPESRLRLILRSCEPLALLTEARLRDRATALAPPGCEVIELTSVLGESDAALPDVQADAPLFVCFTSGSTGEPKGVVQTHRNVLFYADGYSRTLRIAADDRLSLIYTLSVGAGNQNVFRALTNGATLCAYDMRRDGIPNLADWLDRGRITLLQTVPTVFREMATRLTADRKLPHLRAIHLGGESVFGGDVELFRTRTLGHCVLVHQLAATEASVIAQNILSHRDVLPPTPVVPAGRPIDGVRLEIRRDDGTAAAVDEVGELFVCGAHLSPGYWRRPDLDAAAFCADPAVPGSRRYRSGDLGRIDAEGTLHFLGRRGSRVKIRGHSVDLGEIESALSQCPGVARAAVASSGSESAARSTSLTAYVEMDAGARCDPRALRRGLARRLPAYMVPAHIVFADALPRTAGGKVDRSALAALDVSAPAIDLDIVPPQDDVERTIAGVFEALLGHSPVGRDDDFFLLGGDSLLGVELQARVRQAFNVHPGGFHEEATVAAIASRVRDAIARPAAGEPLPVIIPLWRNGSEPPLFLVHGRHGQAFVSPHFMRLLGDDQPVWAFQARGLDGLSMPHATVEDMAADYLAGMREVQPQGPYFIGSMCAGAWIAAVMARALRATGETVLPLLLLDPPNTVFQLGYAQIGQEGFVDKMLTRRARRGYVGPSDSPAYVQALITTAKAFEDAIVQHRPQPYDGPVYVLSSRQRMQDPVALRRVFTGRFKRYHVGTNHSHALDPHNPAFAQTLLRCVGLIREAARNESSRRQAIR